VILRVFLDASVLFSAAYSSSGFARDLLVSGYRPDVTLSVSPDVVDEVTLNLSSKRPKALATLRSFIADGSLLVVSPDPSVVRRCADVVDEKDAHVVAGALAAGASIVATFDLRHLLSQADLIRAAFGVEVLTPRDVLERIATDE